MIDINNSTVDDQFFWLKHMLQGLAHVAIISSEAEFTTCYTEDGFELIANILEDCVAVVDNLRGVYDQRSIASANKP